MSKTYRINGKVVNSITNYSRDKDTQEVKNYAEDNSQGLAAAPIYCEIKKRITAIGSRKLFTFNDYGLAQIQIQLKGDGPAVDTIMALLIVKDEKGKNIVNNLIAKPATQLDIIATSETLSIYAFVKPGYTCHIDALVSGTIGIRGYYRLHNTNSENMTEKGINNYHKFISDYSVNNSQVLEYDKENEEWKGLKSMNDNANVTNNALECARYGSFGITGIDIDENNPYTFKEDGYMELDLTSSATYYLSTQLTTTLRDENGKVVKQWLEEFVHPKLISIAFASSTTTYGHFVKKGWTIGSKFIGIEGSIISGVIVKTKNYLDWNDTPKEKETKTLSFGGEIVNDINIEQYNTDAKEWEPLNEKSGSKNERRIHTKPYLASGEQTEAIILGGSEFTCPTDGIVSIKFATNALVEFESNINIDVYDTNGKKVDSSNGRVGVVALRPEQLTYSAICLTEVKKGYKIKINTTGISGGRGWYFLRLDPTYSLVDENGNYI